MKIVLLFLLVVLSAAGQTNLAISTNRLENVGTSSSALTLSVQAATNQQVVTAEQVEKARLQCIESRRQICGKILKIFPEGLVIDSGYTNLGRAPLNRSWLVPGTVVAERPAHAIEENQPDSMCFGLVFLTDIPKIRGTKPKLYDYVNLEGYPTGQYTYTSVGNLQRTVRKFSTRLARSVDLKLREDEK